MKLYIPPIIEIPRVTNIVKMKFGYIIVYTSGEAKKVSFIDDLSV